MQKPTDKPKLPVGLHLWTQPPFFMLFEIELEVAVKLLLVMLPKYPTPIMATTMMRDSAIKYSMAVTPRRPYGRNKVSGIASSFCGRSAGTFVQVNNGIMEAPR